MMRTAAAVVLGGILAMGSIPAAHAAQTRDLYMVSGVERVDDYYIGDFGVLRKQGKTVIGAVGAFNSEYGCVKGRVTSGKLRGTFYPLEGPSQPTSFSKRWVGAGDKQRLAGFQSVSRKKLRVYLNGQNPDRFLRYCLTHV